FEWMGRYCTARTAAPGAAANDVLQERHRLGRRSRLQRGGRSATTAQDARQARDDDDGAEKGRAAAAGFVCPRQRSGIEQPYQRIDLQEEESRSAQTKR